MITDYIKYHNDNAYIVKREIAKHNFTNKQTVMYDWVQMYRDEMGYDHVLQNETHFFFCERIEDAQIIEENA